MHRTADSWWTLHGCTGMLCVPSQSLARVRQVAKQMYGVWVAPLWRCPLGAVHGLATETTLRCCTTLA